MDALVDENEFNTTNMSLVQRISALHVVHHRSQSQILWFGQLVAHSPGIMVLLKRDDIRDQEEMVCVIPCMLAAGVLIQLLCIYYLIL